ncbi:MAG: GtrA family protein, partial [Planctomycetes bacterium]|nr:GtrA family protein [Planctomycetota bacterium]
QGDPVAAVMAGLAAARGEIILVLAPGFGAAERALELVSPLLADAADFVIGSRRDPTTAFGGAASGLLFLAPDLVARALVRLRHPRSGCFACRRDRLPALELLAPIGAAVGLEVLVRGAFERPREVAIACPVSAEDGPVHRELWHYLLHLRRLFRFRYPVVSEFLQFGLVGATGFIVDVAFYLALQAAFGLEHLMARALSFWCSATWNWALNRKLTFADRKRTRKRVQWPAFLLCSVFGFLLNWGTYYTLTEYVPFFGHGITRILAMMLGVIVGMGLNFMLARALVFLPHATGAAGTVGPTGGTA